jgi:lipid-A-disaccharide synthase
MTTVMVSCGEASGDLYAGALTKALEARAPGTRVIGFGGERLAAAGAELAGDYRGIAVTGLTEVLRVLPRTWQMYRRLVDLARAVRPDVFVPIDFPDFNFRLGAAVHALGIPVVYYVSPQLWAWRPGRIDTMKAFVDKVLPIFPFETAIYERAGLPVEFVGHPLIDLVDVVEPRGALLSRLGLDAAAPMVALLPGSRPNEVRSLLPALVEAVGLVRRARPDVSFVLARAPKLADALFEPLAGSPIVVVEGRTDDVIAASDLVLTASGTATVQTALHERPMVILYKLSPLTYRLGRPFVKVDTFGMANLIAGRRVVPELIQDDCTAEKIAAEALSLLTDTQRSAAMRKDLADVRARLGAPGASARAAAAVLAIAEKHDARGTRTGASLHA